MDRLDVAGVCAVPGETDSRAAARFDKVGNYPMNRDELKAACVRHLDERAIEHPAGHQGKLAARYVLRGQGGDVIELMFEKRPGTRPNLWVPARRVTGLLDEGELDYRLAPASILYATKGANGKPVYGRHSALKPMPELAESDLVCFHLASLTQLDRILGHLTE
jgi:hypothetical protein